VIDLLLKKQAAIAAACARYNVARLDAFGSALRHDFVPGKSDIDLLVELAPMDPYARVEAYFGSLPNSARCSRGTSTLSWWGR
jgi:predicted nucleotidyltransferase